MSDEWEVGSWDGADSGWTQGLLKLKIVRLKIHLI